MNTSEAKTLESMAHEMIQRMGSAAGDLTMDLEEYPSEKYKLWCKYNQDVQDKIGAYADHLYCDQDFQIDFLGDWAWDWSDDPEKRIELWLEIKNRERNFTSACDRLICDTKKRMVEQQRRDEKNGLYPDKVDIAN